MKELQRYFWDQDLLLRTVKINGETWFVAKDVCDALQLVNSRKAAGDLDGDEKGVTKVMTRGGMQTMQIVSEAGLYTLMLSSRKPEGARFRRWLFHEVLPSIRKNGSYALGNAATQRPESQRILSLRERVRLTIEAEDRTGAEKAAMLALLDSAYPKKPRLI